MGGEGSIFARERQDLSDPERKGVRGEGAHLLKLEDAVEEGGESSCDPSRARGERKGRR
jgi:hypothetical protein